MHIGVTSHLWLKSASYASSHPCMCTCVLRCDCFLLACLVLYLVSPFSFQPFQMSTSALNERSRSNPLCDFRLGTVVTSDYETPLTETYVGSLKESMTEQRFFDDVDYADAAIGETLFNPYREQVYHSHREGLSVGQSSSVSDRSGYFVVEIVAKRHDRSGQPEVKN